MKYNAILYLVLFFVLLISNLSAQDSTRTQIKNSDNKQQFVDENNDGYNDNAPDHDGDGIPNALDPDWKKLQKERKRARNRKFIDLDGDGINDNIQNVQRQKGKQIQQQGMEDQNGSSMESGRERGQGQGQNTGKGQGEKQKGKRK